MSLPEPAPSVLGKPGSPWRHTLLFGGVVLACGVVLGMALATQLPHGDRSDSGPPDRTPDGIVQRLQKELDLNEKQAVEVKAIIETGMAETESIRAKIQPEMEAHMDRIHKQVGALLTPDQLKKWDARYERIRKRHHFGTSPGMPAKP